MLLRHLLVLLFELLNQFLLEGGEFGYFLWTFPRGRAILFTLDRCGLSRSLMCRLLHRGSLLHNLLHGCIDTTDLWHKSSCLLLALVIRLGLTRGKVHLLQ